MYLLYSLALFVLITGTALYITRSRWLPAFNGIVTDATHILTDVRFPGRAYLYSQLPTSFAGDMEAGLTSSNFDLTGNVEGNDSRGGLDAEAKREILKIMKRRRIQFDEARRVYMEQRFQANGIGADGRPRDPKFVSFS